MAVRINCTGAGGTAFAAAAIRFPTGAKFKPALRSASKINGKLLPSKLVLIMYF